MRPRRWLTYALGSMAGLGALAACEEVPTVELTVDTTADTADAVPGDGSCADGTGACSLRAAVDEANAAPAGTHTQILVPAGVYPLAGAAGDDANASGDLDLTGHTTLTATGAAVIDGGGNDRVVDVLVGAEVSITGITVRGGTAAEGAGVRTRGQAGLHQVTLTANTATSSVGGGAIATDGGALAVANTTVSGNAANGGAGLASDASSRIDVAYSTVTANDGGGLHVSGTATLGWSVVADQSSGADCSGVAPDTQGYNVTSDATCLRVPGPGDVTNAAASLKPIDADAGGTTATHLPRPDSEALDRIPAGTAGCTGLATDQRGVARPKDATCDSGAVEVRNTEPGSYTLYALQGTDDAFLVDEDGDVVNHWTAPGSGPWAAYMLDDGRITFIEGVLFNDGQTVHVLDWDGNVEWSYTPGTYHHDLDPMPNGNLLLITYDRLDPAEAVALGRDPATATLGVDALEVLEVDPTDTDGDPVVWRWKAIDHLVQDHDPNLPGYGDPSAHPELLDINYIGTDRIDDWDHANGIDYNPEHDQIVLSLRSFSEVWVIDHSTTTAEAAGHTGGDQGKGGDVLYRWGNPVTYGRGTAADQTLYYQHDPTWIPTAEPGGYSMLAFSNGNDRPGGESSTVEEWRLPVGPDGSYPPLGPGEAHGPAAPGWTWQADPPTSFFQPFISGAQRVAGGNTLIAGGPDGMIFEVDPAGNEVFRIEPGRIFKVRRYTDFNGTEPVATPLVP